MLTKTQSSANEDKRLAGLDGLRAISILLVIANHLMFVRDGQGVYVNWFPVGGFGVTIFFVISGFLITYLLCEEESRKGRVSVPAFYYRRAFRILPPALIYLAITAPLSTRADLWNSVLFIRNFFPGNVTNGHFWSLSVEEQFYLLWPALFVLLRNNRLRLYVIGPLLLVMHIWGVHADKVAAGHPWSMYGFPFPHAGYVFGLIVLFGHYPILTGCCFALLRQRGWMRWKWMSSSSTAAASLVALIVLKSGITGDHGGILIPALVALIINWAVSQSHSFLDWQPLAWIGVLSYSLYLWQQIFCYESPLPIVGTFPINIAATFAAAMASYYGIEKPALRLRAWLKSAPRGDSVGMPIGNSEPS